jgi:hypothetical protein
MRTRIGWVGKITDFGPIVPHGLWRDFAILLHAHKFKLPNNRIQQTTVQPQARTSQKAP